MADMPVRDSVESEVRLNCPACGSVVAGTAFLCAACGRNLRIEIAVAQVANPKLAYQAAREIAAFDPSAGAVADMAKTLAARTVRFSTRRGWTAANQFVSALGVLQVQAAVVFTADPLAGEKRTLKLPGFSPRMAGGAAFAVLVLLAAVWANRDTESPSPVQQTIQTVAIGQPAGSGEDLGVVRPRIESQATIEGEAAETPADGKPVEKPAISFEKIRRSIVVISTEKGALGSGFAVAPGQMVTNRHVVQGLFTGSSVKVSFLSENGESDTVSARVAQVSDRLDLALITCAGECEAVPALPLGKAAVLETGDTVFALGNPLGLSLTLTKGIVSSRERNLDGILFVQSDVPVNPGNSGGPLLNTAGEVVGVVTAKARFAEGISFILPIEYAVQGRTPILSGVLPVSEEFSPEMLTLMQHAGVQAGAERQISNSSLQPREALQLTLAATASPAINAENKFMVRFATFVASDGSFPESPRYFLIVEQRVGGRSIVPLSDIGKPIKRIDQASRVTAYYYEYIGKLPGSTRLEAGDTMTVRLNDDLLSNAQEVQIINR